MAALCQQQDGGSMLLCKRYVNNKMAAMRYYGEVILHLQQYSRRLNLFFVNRQHVGLAGRESP